MTHKALLTLTALILTLTFSACWNDDEKYADYDDTAVISFQLQQMNAYVHTTGSDGKDSVFRAYVDGTKVPIYIDHINYKIYNVDSLPVGTDMEHIVVELSTKNKCYAMWRSLEEDRLLYHSSEDSLDFSVPRELYVFTTDGEFFRKYDVNITKHQQEGDNFYWKNLGTNTTFAALTGMRAVSEGNMVYLAGSNGSNTQLYYSDINDGANWTLSSISMPASAWQTMLMHNGKPHLTDGNGTLYVVNLDANGTPTGMTSHTVSGLKTIIASDNEHLYGINTEGNIMRTALPDSYNNWTDETLDDDKAWLPVQHITSTHMPLVTDNTAGKLIVVGNRDVAAFPADTAAVIWGKMIGSAEITAGGTWMHYVGQSSSYCLPHLYNLCTIPYGKDIVALGGQPIGNTKTPALSSFFRSIDGGVSWRKDTRISMPKDFQSSATVFAMTVDSNNYIWLICGESGQIWKGRLNRMAWTEHQKEFKAAPMN